MEMKCEYCGAMIDATVRECPNCGGVNKNMRRSVDGTPKTIAQLKQWYIDRKLPPEETTRFFIGKNYKGARAIGIYEENGRFIVYKNKANGERAIRYEGTDEAYAVNEVYLKLKDEILNQRSHNVQRAKSPRARKRKRGGTVGNVITAYVMFTWIVPIFIAIVTSSWFVKAFVSLLVTAGLWVALFILFAVINGNDRITRSSWFERLRNIEKWKRGIGCIVAVIVSYIGVLCIVSSLIGTRYFIADNGDVYCKHNWTYYGYDGFDYYPVDRDDVPYEIIEAPSSYQYEDWNSDSSFVEFRDSTYYDDNFRSDDSSYDWDSGSSWDSSYDWDSGSSWDSGYSSWDSDW